MGLPLIATNDTHYVNADDASAQVLCLCPNRKTIEDTQRMRYIDTPDFYQSPDEMTEDSDLPKPSTILKINTNVIWN